jgi:hypothetical protein
VTERDIREFTDALSTTTRAERKYLLVASAALVLLSWGGLAPTKISAMGLELGAVNTVLLVVVAWLATAYFFLAFVSTIGPIGSPLRIASHAFKPRSQTPISVR